MYNIGQFAKLIGFSMKTLQRWDRNGILKPETRTKGKNNTYLEDIKEEFNKIINNSTLDELMGL